MKFIMGIIMKLMYAVRGIFIFLIIAIIALVVLFVVYMKCISNYNTNYLRKYSGFLNYSLGEYSVLETHKEKYRGDLIPIGGTYKYWRLEYSSDDGEKREYAFHNRAFGESHNIHFAYDVINEAYYITTTVIETEVMSKYFSKEQISANDFPVKVWLGKEQGSYYEREDEKSFCKSILDDKTGMQLKSITAHDLVTQWGCEYKLELRTNLEDEAAVKELLEKFKAMVCDVAEFTGQDMMKIEFEYRGNDDLSYKGSYNRQSGEFEWKSETQLAYERKYTPDGKLRAYNDVTFNGKEVNNIGPVGYNEDDKKYYATAYFIKGIAEEIGKYDKDNNINWTIDDTDYVFTNKGREYEISRNGKVVFELKDEYMMNGTIDYALTLPQFEEITGTEVTLDSENEVVIVTSVKSS